MPNWAFRRNACVDLVALWSVQWCNVRCCNMVLLLCCQIWFQSSLRIFSHSNYVQPNHVFWQHSRGTAGRFAVCVILCLPTCTFSFRSFLVFFPHSFFLFYLFIAFERKRDKSSKITWFNLMGLHCWLFCFFGVRFCVFYYFFIYQ